MRLQNNRQLLNNLSYKLQYYMLCKYLVFSQTFISLHNDKRKVIVLEIHDVRGFLGSYNSSYLCACIFYKHCLVLQCYCRR